MPFFKRAIPPMLLALSLCTGCSGGGGGGGATDGTKTSALLQSCPALPPTAQAAGSLAAAIDTLVTSDMQAKGLPGMTVMVAKDGVPVYSQAYGYADLATCRRAQPETIYQIGSVTKQFTAAAILQLQNAGQLRLDATVASYLPAYGFSPQLTLRMLLNQTSGLPEYVEFSGTSTWANGVPQSTVLTAIARAQSLFSPGAAYAYSNSNYFVLAAIIEAISGASYGDYLSQHIFRPLGLDHTSYARPAAAAFATPYTYTRPLVAGSQGLAVGIIPDPSYLFGAAAIWSTTADLAKWDAALRTGTVIPPALFDMFITPPGSVALYQQPGTLTSYAMGWVSSMVATHSFIWHNGTTFAYSAFNGFLNDDGVSVSILTNVDVHETTPAMVNLGSALMTATCGTAAGAVKC